MGLGIIVGDPIIETFQSQSKEGIISELSHFKLNNDLRMLLVILDRSLEKLYKDIKRYIYTEVGTPSQIIKVENLSKNLSYYTNVLTQMVSKMGSRLYSIDFHDNLKKLVIKKLIFLKILANGIYRTFNRKKWTNI